MSKTKEEILKIMEKENWQGKFKVIYDLRTGGEKRIPLEKVEQEWIQDVGQELWDKLSTEKKEFLMMTGGSLDFTETWFSKLLIKLKLRKPFWERVQDKIKKE